MDEGRLMLLSQLANTLRSAFDYFERAYDSSDKEKFENSKRVMLEAQKKIEFLLKQEK